MTRLRLPDSAREQTVGSPREVFDLFNRFSGSRVEHFFIATLDGAHRVIAVREVSKGLVNRTVVHPREVFWYAIKDMASAVILGHNHPSGRVEPSPEDMDLTRRLTEAGEVIGIHVLDHVVVARRRTGNRERVFYSMREHGISFDEEA